MRHLSIEGKVLICKALAILYIVHLVLLKEKPSSTITQLSKIQREFIWKNGNLKMKHSALCDDYKNGELKDVISLKMTSLQQSWVSRLYDLNFHCWKVKTSFHLKSYLGQK